MKKSKHRQVEQNVNLTRQQPGSSDAPPGELSKRATQLKILVEETATGDVTIEWVSVYKGTDIAIPMRHSHVIGKLQVALFILSKQFYGGQAPETRQVQEPPAK